MEWVHVKGRARGELRRVPRPAKHVKGVVRAVTRATHQPVARARPLVVLLVPTRAPERERRGGACACVHVHVHVALYFGGDLSDITNVGVPVPVHPDP